MLAQMWLSRIDNSFWQTGIDVDGRCLLFRVDVKGQADGCGDSIDKEGIVFLC